MGWKGEADVLGGTIFGLLKIGEKSGESGGSLRNHPFLVVKEAFVVISPFLPFIPHSLKYLYLIKLTPTISDS